MKLLVVVLTFLFSFQAHSKEVLMLVPGFFNSFTAEYFSDEIIETFQDHGLQVYVAEGLNPIGTIEDNGERLAKIMADIETAEGHKVSFNILAHSAGGLYALYVADKQKFEIKNLITISTPYKGVEFIQKWLDDCTLFKAVTDLAHLDGLVQLTPKGIAAFFDKIRVSPDMKIIAYGGYQPKSLDVWNARNLSFPFRITSHYISEDSDGIVGFSSAVGIGAIKTTANTPARQFVNKEYLVSLEHWEQVLDSNSFFLLGIRNPGYIRNEQIRFYTGIADYLMTIL